MFHSLSLRLRVFLFFVLMGLGSVVITTGHSITDMAAPKLTIQHPDIFLRL